MSNKSLCGLDISVASNLSDQYENSMAMGFAFLSTYMFHPRLKQDYIGDSTSQRSLPGTRSDFVLSEGGKSFANSVVGKISPWIDVDSDCPKIRKNSEKALLLELGWATYLSLPAVSLVIQRRRNPNLARILTTFFAKERCPFKVWVHIPIVNPYVDLDVDLDDSSAQKVAETIPENGDPLQTKNIAAEKVSPVLENGDTCGGEASSEDVKHAKPAGDLEDTWHWWNELVCQSSNYADSLGVLLELSEDLPSLELQDRWFSEPVAALLLPTSVFCTNRRDYPVLPSSHQTFLSKFIKLNLQIVITGACRHKKGYSTYQQYINWLWKNNYPVDLYTQQSKGLEDHLQEPLQPLADNLCSQTYVIFEMDPYKYKAYEDAVYEALLARYPNVTADSFAKTSKPLVMVLGAGRGPLVAASLAAADRAKIPIKMIAVEKNPNAVITLQNRLHEEWRERDVRIIAGDMRQQEPNLKADIFVSELLGSFGDNELSPECLDGAQHFLKSDGISIPSSYTSFLAPMQSLKVYKEVTSQKDPNKPEYVSFETPYVVRLLNCNILAEPQAAFRFDHPKIDMSDDNSRYICLSFKITMDSVLHGFAGYFDSKLFGSIDMSILPSNHSPDMFSWFPIMFPLERPVHLRAGDQVTVHLWRVVTTKSVWYEWCLSEPYPTRIHNPNGRSYTIGL